MLGPKTRYLHAGRSNKIGCFIYYAKAKHARFEIEYLFTRQKVLTLHEAKNIALIRYGKHSMLIRTLGLYVIRTFLIGIRRGLPKSKFP